MTAVPITLSPSAAARVAFIATKQAKPAILRLSVEGGGCSGFNTASVSPTPPMPRIR
jgi:Fe-S cluster assembly iron-binding protein IscA